jgi:hypothetical protein
VQYKYHIRHQREKLYRIIFVSNNLVDFHFLVKIWIIFS